MRNDTEVPDPITVPLFTNGLRFYPKLQNKTETYKFYCEKVKIEREIGGTGFKFSN